MQVSEITWDREGLAAAIACEDPAFEAALCEEAYRVKVATVGPEVYLRGLVEISNICVKNCFYCGIRHDIRCPRYELSDEAVLSAMQTAADRRFGSVVIQGGERTDAAFIRKITRLLKEIKQIDTGVDPPLGITLSLGEQPREVYEEWFDAGAHRYLLRIEAGTGAMIGMPFQTAEDLADDLLFYQKFDAPMVGMGPYNPHPETPLTLSGAPYPSAERRFALGLKMIALLRLLMPDINIAAATSLEVLDPRGREMGLLSGANVFMPNLTPREQMVKYSKTALPDGPSSLADSLSGQGIVIGYGRWGDSKHGKSGLVV